MDGNGRWAQERGQPRIDGHRAGAKTVRDIVTYARELGIRYLTLYAFSTENWGRPETEVQGLMSLLADYLTEERPTLLKNRIELGTIGNTDKLPAVVRLLLADVKRATKGLDGMRLTLALSYSSKDEIVRAVKTMAQNVDDGKLDPEKIDAELLAKHLDTHGMPDPDLLIRTSGEQRISNFMLWQLAYSEFYFTDVAWPDFSRAVFDQALAAYCRRERRFGLTGAQVTTPNHVAGTPANTNTNTNTNSNNTPS